MEIDGHFTKRRQEKHVMEVRIKNPPIHHIGFVHFHPQATIYICDLWFELLQIGAGTEDGAIQGDPAQAINSVFVDL